MIFKLSGNIAPLDVPSTSDLANERPNKVSDFRVVGMLIARNNDKL